MSKVFYCFPCKYRIRTPNIIEQSSAIFPLSRKPVGLCKHWFYLYSYLNMCHGLRGVSLIRTCRFRPRCPQQLRSAAILSRQTLTQCITAWTRTIMDPHKDHSVGIRHRDMWLVYPATDMWNQWIFWRVLFRDVPWSELTVEGIKRSLCISYFQHSPILQKALVIRETVQPWVPVSCTWDV